MEQNKTPLTGKQGYENTLPSKKKEVYKETFRKGVFETNREKVSKWALDNNTWMEVINGGINSDDTEFVTIKFNNLPH